MGGQRFDAEIVLAFVAEAGDLNLRENYPPALLTLLQGVVQATWVMHQEADHHRRQFVALDQVGPDGDDDDLYWATGPCPTQALRACTGELRAVRTSDLVDVRRWHELPVYREYFHPAGVEHILDLGLSSQSDRVRSLVFMRETGDKAFSERDRDVLETLRPHLRHLEEKTRLRHMAEACRCHLERPELVTDPDVDPAFLGFSGLTAREREIVELVASGKTNFEIATAIWVAPSTVKKHLEHIYAKLGLRRRAEVVAARYAHGAAGWQR